MIIEDSSNFREIAMGGIASGVLFRSNHPIHDKQQVKDIILAANKAKIKTVINLCDSFHKLQSQVICCPWYKKALDGNNVIALGLSMRFDPMEKKFCRKIQEAISFMIDHEPPYLIHCQAGMDRTGFFSILLESLMGAHIDEMAKDYMLSFVENSEYSENDYMNGFRFLCNLFSKLKGGLLTPDDDLQMLITSYLIEKVKLSQDSLDDLKSKLGGILKG